MTDSSPEAPLRMTPLPDNARVQRLGALQVELVAFLRAQDLDAAGEAFARLVAVGGWLDLGFGSFHRHLKAQADAARLEATFLDMLLYRRDVSFAFFKIITTILELGVATHRGHEIYEEIAALVADEGAPPPRFSNFDFLSFAARLGPKNTRLLARLKYKGAERFRPGDIPGIAGHLAQRIDLVAGLEERLSAATRFPNMPPHQWAAAVKQAFAIDSVLADGAASISFMGEDVTVALAARQETLRNILDFDAIKHGFKYLNPNLGTIVAMFHGGFINLVCDAFILGTKKGLFMSRMGGPNMISIQDPRAALFLSMRAILDGRSVLIGADARTGKYNATIRVLDVDVPVADGGPFIAFETGCETVWLAVEHSKNGFAPVFVQGPSRREGEKFVDFRERWLSFYAYQVNRILTGDPRDLTVRMQWAALFSKGLDYNRTYA